MKVELIIVVEFAELLTPVTFRTFQKPNQKFKHLYEYHMRLPCVYINSDLMNLLLHAEKQIDG